MRTLRTVDCPPRRVNCLRIECGRLRRVRFYRRGAESAKGRRGGVLQIVTLSTVVFAAGSVAAAQSSSLFLEGEQVAEERMAATQPARAGVLAASAGAALPSEPNANVPLNETSFMAVPPPKTRAFKKNDAVTIIVIERMRYRSDNQFQQDKRWDFESKLAEFFRIHDHKWVQQPFRGGIPEIDLENNDRRTGNGRQNRQDELTTRITAEVIDVLPNGQLMLQATREIKFEEEQQVIALFGRCRSEDVTADNSVLSTQLINPVVTTENKGQVSDAGKRGWLQKAFDKVRPF